MSTPGRSEPTIETLLSSLTRGFLIRDASSRPQSMVNDQLISVSRGRQGALYLYTERIVSSGVGPSPRTDHNTIKRLRYNGVACVTLNRAAETQPSISTDDFSVCDWQRCMIVYHRACGLGSRPYDCAAYFK